MRPITHAAAFFIATALSFAPMPAAAHFVWIEVDPRAEPGKSQEVQVYFGEPHEFLREETGGRLDQHDGLQGWVVSPKAEKAELGLRKALNRFAGGFVPTAVGRHNVVVTSRNHEVQDLTQYERGFSKPLFYARAQFLSFQEGRISEREREIREFLDLDIIPVTKALDPVKGSIVSKTGDEVVIRVIFRGRPLANRRVNAFGPNGWVKELQSTDSWGITSFVPLWAGRHVLVVTMDEKAPGEFKGKKYERLSHRASLSILVGKSD